jgi:acyl carrier protein
MTAELAIQLAAIGLAPVREAAAGEALKQALLGDEPQIVSAEVNWARFRSVYEARPGRRLLAELGVAEAPSMVREPRSSILDDLQGEPPGRQFRLLSGYLAQQVGDILGLAAGAEVGLDEPLVNLGMDSLMAVELQSRVSRDLREELNPTLIFDHPTIALIAAHLISDVLNVAEGPPARPAASARPQVSGESASMDELVALELARLETALGGR